MNGTERVALPWWVEAGLKFLREFGFPAGVAAYVLITLSGEVRSSRDVLMKIATTLEERLPRTNR